jgi:hypothetical protein
MLTLIASASMIVIYLKTYILSINKKQSKKLVLCVHIA